MTMLRKVLNYDANGNPIGSLNGGLNVHDADSHFGAVSVHARLDSGTSETFGVSGASVGVNVFDVAAGQGGTYSVDDHIVISEGVLRESNVLKILNVSTDTLTVDRPLENAYTSAGVIELTSIDLATANGSIVSPVIYTVAPPLNEIWHIRTMLFTLIDGTQSTIDRFGGINGLTNGLVVREENGRNRNLAVLRTNADMKEYFGGHEVEFIQRSGGGDWATNAIWHYEEHTESAISLDGAASEVLKFIIQDDFTDLTEFEIICQGHLEG